MSIADGVAPTTDPPRSPRVSSQHVLVAVLVGALVVKHVVGDVWVTPAVRTAATVFVAVCVQALPFLVLGVLVSGVLAAFVTPAVLRRLLPRRTAAAVAVAGLAGMALPGCECASVPVSRRLIGHGVPDAAALAFLLAAPAVNPVVLVATAVAFPGEPRMVAARFVGSLATACGTGWLWQHLGRAEWIAERARRGPPPSGANRWAVLVETARHDLVSAGSFLVVGAAFAAVLGVLLPSGATDALADHVVLGIVTMATLAVVLALCSEADAFVAASLATVPLLARLVFLVVGPAVDVKLVALQVGAFGRAFALRFAPLTLVVAVACAVGAGLLVLGGVR